MHPFETKEGGIIHGQKKYDAVNKRFSFKERERIDKHTVIEAVALLRVKPGGS